MKRDVPLMLTIAAGLVAVVLLAHLIDHNRRDTTAQFAEERLYLNGSTAKHLTLAFNGIAADWYWMRSLQYVGRKIVNYEDTHEGNFNLGNLSGLNLQMLAPLLRVSTTLDPQFMAPYEYGAFILPEITEDDAISLLKSGIAANPSSWRLHQHLGYIYWQQKNYEQASATYSAGAKLPGAPPWMGALAARMKAEGGSRDAAREMYRHLYEASNDESVKDMVTKQVMRIDSLDDRDAIRRMLAGYRTQSGKCAASWRDVSASLRTTRLKIDTNGAPLDPSGTAYRLIKDGCDVDLDLNTSVPRR